MTKLKVLVTGATGTQGGAIARLLLERGHAVRAVTRKPDSPAAQALAGRGAEIAVGDLADRAAMDAAAKGVDAVFSMGTPFEAGPAAEIRQGVTVADAAAAAGAFLLYTSVASADKQTKIPHFDSKFEVEQHIRSRGMTAAIIAPVYFMENVRFSQAQLAQGVLPSPMSPGRTLSQIAAADIAAAAVAVLEDRERHAGKRYDLVGDDLTGEEAARVLSEASGRSIRYVQIPLDVIRQAMGEDGALMYDWFERVGYAVDRAALARDFPGVQWTSYAAWARGFDWAAFFGG